MPTSMTSQQQHQQHQHQQKHQHQSSSSNWEPVGNLAVTMAAGARSSQSNSSTRNFENSATPQGSRHVCDKCHQPISGQFVRALNGAYHLNCFVCYSCGTPCAAKFFPVDAPASQPGGLQVPFCQHCYFKQLDLLCCRCGEALRGSYITALGRKYHVEHFTCSLCPTIFGPEDSYFEYAQDVYCHYHYSTLYASRCEGCRTAILKQFVETYRGGREQQWHPECYMIFKFWNVRLHTPEAFDSKPDAVSSSQRDSNSDSLNTSVSSHTPDHASVASSKKIPSDEERKRVYELGKYIDSTVLGIWVTLCGFEEASAQQISRMVLTATAGSYRDSLKAVSKLVSLVQQLFEALDVLDPMVESHLGKEPKTLCRKIVSYLSLLSKTRNLNRTERTEGLAQDLLAMSSSMAHYLKVLIRYGLSASLKCDRQQSNEGSVLSLFLSLVDPNRKTPVMAPKTSAMASDRCFKCSGNVEDICVRLKELVWHVKCFECASCRRNLSENLDDALFHEEKLLCRNCTEIAPKDPSQTFVRATRLQQYIYLLHIALKRLELVLSKASSLDHHTNLRSAGKILSPDTKTKSSNQSPRISADRDGLKKASNSSANTLNTNSFLFSSSDQESLKSSAASVLECASELLTSKQSLTLDDIRRIVASEQAREHMPNAFRHRDCPSSTQQPEIKSVNTKSLWFGDLSPEDHSLVQQIALVLLQPLINGKVSEEELQVAVEMEREKPTIWAKMGKALSAPSKKKNGVFGVPLEQLVVKYGMDSSLGVGSYALRIPLFVDDCVCALRQKDMSIEGIFRKNGNIRRIRELVETIDKHPNASSLLADEQPIQLAALFKRFLRDMPEPLLGSKLGKVWIAVSQIEPELRPQVVRLTVCLLARPYRDLLEVLVYFLNWTASFAQIDDESGSKMDARNLATVVTPNIFDKSHESDTNGERYFQAIEAVHILIDQYILAAEVPPDVQVILSKLRNRGVKRERLSNKEFVELVRELAPNTSGTTLTPSTTTTRTSSDQNKQPAQ